MGMDMSVNNALIGILLAFGAAYFATRSFPAETHSKLWVKILGSEWGTAGKGRGWTFMSVFIVVALHWGVLLWFPTNP